MKPADVMISETFDAALIGEKFLSILTHAKSSGLLKKKSVIIPNSAIIFGELMESTFSLRRGENNTSFLHSGKFNLEPMRKFRPANVYTVRYLNEMNAVRKRLSVTQPLFHYDFQNYSTASNFAYKCLTFKVTKDGIFDSIGLWFNLYLDKEKTLIVSNSPYNDENFGKSSPCWMQYLYRVSQDVYLRKGEFVRKLFNL